MQLTKTLFVCATLIATTVAQSPTTTSLHFTSIPTSLVAGVKQSIGWAGGNGNGVNIILQQGSADNLLDVPIAPIASGDQGTSTTWTPPKSLPDAGNYALRIEQGEDAVNYSGMLQLFGGCSTCPTDAVAALATASSSTSSMSSTGSATASSPSSTASSSSKSGVVTPIVAPGSKSSSNSTGAAGSLGNSTTTGSSMNSTMGTGSMANMTMPGTNSTTNSTTSSTMSTAKLHATSSKSSSSSSTSSSSTSSSSSESTSSSTGSSTSPSATKKSSGVTVAASNFALVLCAIVGVVYLG